MDQAVRLLSSRRNEMTAGVPSIETGAEAMRVFERFVAALEGIQAEQRRIADHFDPPPPDVVGTDYVAERLDCTKVWVSQLARDGEIPRACIVPGTGNGRPWKFRRSRVDEWLMTR